MGLAQCRVGRLPFPLHPAKFVTHGGLVCPDPLDDSRLGPALEPVVDGALGPASPEQLVALAAAAHPEDDRVERLPPIGELTPGQLLGPEGEEIWLDPQPQLFGDFPDRAQRLTSRLPADHGSACAQERLSRTFDHPSSNVQENRIHKAMVPNSERCISTWPHFSGGTRGN